MPKSLDEMRRRYLPGRKPPPPPEKAEPESAPSVDGDQVDAPKASNASIGEGFKRLGDAIRAGAVSAKEFERAIRRVAKPLPVAPPPHRFSYEERTDTGVAVLSGVILVEYDMMRAAYRVGIRMRPAGGDPTHTIADAYEIDRAALIGAGNMGDLLAAAATALGKRAAEAAFRVGWIRKDADAAIQIGGSILVAMRSIALALVIPSRPPRHSNCRSETVPIPGPSKGVRE